MSGKIKWDGIATATLKNMLQAGKTYREIAAKLHCSPAAVGGQVHRLGLTQHPEKGRRRRAPNYDARKPSLDGITFNGEPLQFAATDRPCARCAVRETVHHQHGCGQFAAEVRVRIS
jgi:hypothetical protein